AKLQKISTKNHSKLSHHKFSWHSATAPKKKKNKNKTRIKPDIYHNALLAWLYLLPAGLFLCIFMLYPMLKLFWDSFFQWDGFSTRYFIGLQHYKALIIDPRFWSALKNTAVFLLGSIPTGMALSLALAILIQKKISGRSFFRTVFFAPYVTSMVAAGLIWVWFLNYDYGILNTILSFAGFEKIPWLISEKYAMLSVIIMTIWKDLGYGMILFLAGLQNIDPVYYEAAKLDGANRWQIFSSITWPLLLPATLFILVTKVIFHVRAFEQIYAMTKGGPAGATTTGVYYIYQKAFQQFEMGYASAAAIILLIIVLIMAGLLNRLNKIKL
ncbi:MAG: sugar ABC transporter permease, partial [bacterium]|nr:sugar ABC transporter permease [bacterium]